MQPKYNYRRGLPHIQKDYRPIFMTFTTDHRWQLPIEARDIVLECCLKENGTKFDLHTAVVMPDHAHLLLSPLRNADGWNFSLPQIMHAIKGASARRINMLLDRHGPVWQEEFFDHVLRSNDRPYGEGRLHLPESGASRIGQNRERISMVVEREHSHHLSLNPAAFQAA